MRLSRKRSKDKITTSLKQCVNQNDMLYKKQLKNSSIENVTKYRKYKNILNFCLKHHSVRSSTQLLCHHDLIFFTRIVFQQFLYSEIYGKERKIIPRDTRLLIWPIWIHLSLTQSRNVAYHTNSFLNTICCQPHAWNMSCLGRFHDLYSLSGRTSYSIIPRGLEAARLDIIMMV